MRIQSYSNENERGYILVFALSFVMLGSMLAVGIIELSSTSTQVASYEKIRSREKQTSEGEIHHIISFLRKYSQQMVTPFRREEFYSRFTKTDFTVGDNDTWLHAIPTAIKLKGTNNSAILLNGNDIGTAAFPYTRDITTNQEFKVLDKFSSEDFKGYRVRLTLVNAIADEPSLDFGPPPNKEPETDFYPVYRVDVVSREKGGQHYSAILKSDANHMFDMGLYGQDYLEVSQPCDSYISADGPYTNASKRAKCPAGSNSTSAIRKNEEIYGSLQTNGSIDAEPPYGGQTCADFSNNCPNKGETCAGEDCGVPLLDIFQSWETYCPAGTSQPQINISGTNQVVTPASSNPSDNCWDGIRAGSNKSFILDSVDHPYFIHTLDLANNASFEIKPTDPTKYVEVYVYKIDGDKINGNQFVNASGTPTQFRLYYLGEDNITLNGNAAINAAIVAPNAAATVSGSFDYYGALLARELVLTGSGDFHYDESLSGNGDISNMQYELKQTMQVYK